MERKDKRSCGGFTLVEVLVVMVILAILAAVTIPTFTGYIDKAKEEVYLSEARLVSTGVQTYVIEQYAQGTLDRNNIKKDLMEYELGHPDHALTELLRGSYTEGARISGITVNNQNGIYRGMTYEVEGYEIELTQGETDVVIKKQE